MRAQGLPLASGCRRHRSQAVCKHSVCEPWPCSALLRACTGGASTCPLLLLSPLWLRLSAPIVPLPTPPSPGSTTGSTAIRCTTLAAFPRRSCRSACWVRCACCARPDGEASQRAAGCAAGCNAPRTLLFRPAPAELRVTQRRPDRIYSCPEACHHGNPPSSHRPKSTPVCRPAGAGFEDPWARIAAAFQREAPEEPHEQLSLHLLMATARRPQAGSG